jgi:hypothetical protein
VSRQLPVDQAIYGCTESARGVLIALYRSYK